MLLASLSSLVTPGRSRGHRTGQRRGVGIPDLIDALAELPAFRGAPVAVVVDRVVQVRGAVMKASELRDVSTAGRGVAVELDRARVCGLYEVLPQILPALDRRADLVPADELLADVRPPHHAVLREQRREAVVVTHHPGVGVLASQRVDLDAIRERAYIT